MNELVKLRAKPSRDGKAFKYFLDFLDAQGKRRRISLRHADRRRGERQKAQKERELRMDIVAPESMKLSEFVKDSLMRTGSRIRSSTNEEYASAMKDFISVIGNIDYQRVSLRDAELYRQSCLDKGNSPATVAKKLTEIKAIFQTAVERGQVEENPLRYIKMPKCPKKKVEVYTDEECQRVLRSARNCRTEKSVDWELLILVALSTGMRRGELLNTVWSDIDFDAKIIDVSPKGSTAETWEWLIKDLERRTLPLTEEIVAMLAEHQSEQPEGYPYIFVPPHRYDHIQQLRKNGEWSLSDARLKIISNFGRQFGKILRRAKVRKLKFHDFRNTALSNWFAGGMKEFDVMNLAGHANFSTTHKFYLAVADDLGDRARRVTAKIFGANLARTWHAPALAGDIPKRQPSVST